MVLNYLKVALRSLMRKRMYTITALSGLAIGIASCLLILHFVLDELSYDTYHVNKGRIYRLATQVQGTTFGGIAKVNGPWGPAAISDIPGIEQMTRFVMAGQKLVALNDNRSYENNGMYVDSSVFRMFSYRMVEGDPLTALNAPNSIVLTKSLATKFFGNGEALGQSLQLDGSRECKVTGVLEDVPSNSHFTFSYLLPMRDLTHPQKDNWVQWNQFYTYLLLQDGTRPEDVAVKMKTVLEKNLPPDVAANYTPFLQPLESIHLHSHLHREMRPNSEMSYSYIFSSIALLILAISCANFINLATAQATVRAKEIGVRKVNGAARRQLIAQFLTEAFMISVAALVLAELLAASALPVLNDITGKNLQAGYFLRPVSVLLVVAITFLTALAAGGYPSLYLSSLRPVQVLKGKWSPSGGANLRKGLVVFQFTLSSLLIIASVIILQQLYFIQSKPLGFDPQQIITVPIQDNSLREKFETVKKELLANPAIRNVSLSGNLPGGSDWGMPSIPEGFTSETAPSTRVLAVDHDFIETYGIQMAAGRDFSDTFASDTATYLINEEAVKQYGWTEPLSKTIDMSVVGRPLAPVIGVVKDFHFHSMHEKIGPLLFFVPPRGWFAMYSIKIESQDMEGVLKFIEQKWAAFDPAHPFTYTFFDQAYNSLYQQERRLAQMVGYFTAIGIFLACIGLYSLASFSTEQRTKEIGIRKVVGASNSQIVAMLSGQYLLLVIVGFILAVPVAWWALNQWLQTFAYHVDFNLLLIAGGCLVSMVIALLTVSFRSIQAAWANPVDSLRNE